MESNSIIHFAKNCFDTEIQALRTISNQIGISFFNTIESVINTPYPVIVTGIGKSAHIGNKMVATFNSTGTKAQFLHAAEAIHGDLGMVNEKAVVFVLSKSGNTPEIKALIDLLLQKNCQLIAITSHPNSYLAQKASQVLDVSFEKEACPLNLAPTTSTTAQLVMGDALATVLMRVRGFTESDFAESHPGGSLGKKLYLKVGDIIDITQKPLVEEDDYVTQAIVAISSSRNGITAVQKNGKITGVVTDGDLRRMLFNNIEHQTTRVSEIMSKNPKGIDKEALATQALELIELKKVGQLLVFDGETYIGILDYQDLLKEGIL